MEQPNNNQINFNPVAHKRPLIITVFCILGLIGVAFNIVGIFLDKNISTVSINPMLGVLVILLMLIALVGYWNMRKWGVYMFAVSLLVTILLGVLLDYNPLNIGDFILLGMGVFYFKKMS